MINFNLIKTKPNPISKKTVWVMFHQKYVYADNTLIAVIVKFFKQYKREKYLTAYWWGEGQQGQEND